MEVDTIESITADELRVALEKYGPDNVMDVRRPSEFAAQHIKYVESVPLDFFNDYMGELDQRKKYFIHCAGGIVHHCGLHSQNH